MKDKDILDLLGLTDKTIKLELTKDLEYVIADPIVRKNIQTVLRRDTPIDEIRKRLHVPILLLHECEKTNSATELTDEYLDEIKNYHLNRAIRFFTSQNNRQSKEKIYGYEKIQFHLILDAKFYSHL